MDPGELDKRISLIGLIETGRDAAGAPTYGQGEIARPWAKVIQEGGREFIASSGQQGERKVVFRIWRREGVTTDTVVQYRDAEHDIQDIRAFDDVLELHTVVRVQGIIA